MNHVRRAIVRVKNRWAAFRKRVVSTKPTFDNWLIPRIEAEANRIAQIIPAAQRRHLTPRVVELLQVRQDLARLAKNEKYMKLRALNNESKHSTTQSPQKMTADQLADLIIFNDIYKNAEKSARRTYLSLIDKIGRTAADDIYKRVMKIEWTYN